MSCTVMYQPYAMSYSSSCDRTTADNLKKSFKFPHAPSPPESSHSNASSAYSSPGSTGGSLHHTGSILGTLSLLPPHLHSPSASSVSSLNNGASSQRRPLTPSCASGGGSGASATITSGSAVSSLHHHPSHLSSTSHHSSSSSHHLHNPHHSSSSSSSYHHSSSHHPSSHRGSSSTASSSSAAYPSLSSHAHTSLNLSTGSSSASSATATSTSRDLNSQQQQQQQHGPSSASSSSSSSSHHAAAAGIGSGSASTPSATATSGDHSDDESPSRNTTNSEGASGNGDDSEGATNRAQYLSANCILYVNYDGNTARVVEEHFNRALSASYSGEKSSKSLPMSTRNFPASFWNSNYQPAKASSSAAAAFGYGATAADLYGMDYGASISGFHHHPQADPWHYSLGHHHQAHHHSYHRPSDITYPPMTSTSRFNAAQYGSFLFPSTSAAAAAARFPGIPTPGQCSVKGADAAHHWAAAGGRYDGWSDLHLAADYSAAAAAHYSNMTAAAGKGLDFETHYLQSS